ncbi:peptidase P60 [Paraliobacillus quinghaiensis]|uniref:Peptidase P60 n=1 Tax=Paraliobacillus quinghaiensis TaxID=470815 RepID=A0A917WX20_9BACI|nr:C40 family peptidase [Paraliobacillus quinghaiensis]GGM35984.1 peptidase P60 [Paraliobacillus quinghaiensis]
MNNKKILTSIAVTLGLMVAIPLENETVHAETQSEIEANRAEVQAELKEKKQDLQNIQTKLIELTEEVERFDKAIKANEEMITETADEIIMQEKEVEVLEDMVVELEEDIDKRLDILKERASSLQKNGGAISYLQVIFGSKSFSDFIDRISLVSKIAAADNSLIEQYEDDKNELEEQQSAIKEKLNSLISMQEELKLMQAQIIEQKEANDAKKVELEDKKAKSQAIVNELQLEDSELAQMLADSRVQADSNKEQKIETYSSNTSVSASGDAQSIISVGYKYIGNSVYRFGAGRSARDIANGWFDCSAYVSWAFSQNGVNIPASTTGLSRVGQKVSVSEMKPGDLVFFNTYKTNGHVGIYVGGNQFIGAQSSTGVAIANMGSGYWANRFTGHVRRVIN